MSKLLHDESSQTRTGYETLADDLIDWIGACPFYGKRPHDPHVWTDITIAGELEASCPGVKGRFLHGYAEGEQH